MDADTTPWTRDDWTAFADRLLAPTAQWASENGARITPPGDPADHGAAVDGLEGFARTFLLAAFRIAGERGRGLDDLTERYRRGIAAGVDPDAPDRWPGLVDHAQARVEAAPIALALDLTRPWIWDRLDPTTQTRVVDYLSPATRDEGYSRSNWRWFRIVTQTFLRSVGALPTDDVLASDLAALDSFAREGGWISDGDARAFDHYNAWVLQLHPVLWSRMQGASDLAAPRADAARTRLDRFLLDTRRLIGSDGSPLLQGRSLVYRFAAAAPFWAGVLAEVPSTSPGALRTAAERIVRHFADRGVPDAQGRLNLGWHGEWRRLAQSYSGPGSPYWAANGLLGIVLPPEHPVWSATAEPLPVESGDPLFVVAAPGWIASGTRDDGIVRVVNHGTDHARDGDATADSPLYARFGYSTATSPLLDPEGWSEPLEQSVALVTADGEATHRTGMTPHGVRIDDGAGIGSSTSRLHTADGEHLGTVTVHSVVRGAAELRTVEVDDCPDGAVLRIGGWAVAGDDVAEVADGPRAEATASGLVSSLEALEGDGTPSVAVRDDASPLGPRSAVPVLTFAVRPGDRVVVRLHLGRVDDAPGEH